MRRVFTLMTGMLLFMVLRPVSAATAPYYDSDNTFTGTATVTNNSFDGVFLKSGTLEISKASQLNGLYSYTLGNVDCRVDVTQTEPVYETIPLWVRRYEMGRSSDMDEYVVLSESAPGGGAFESFSMTTGTSEALNWSLSETFADLYDLYAVIEVACDNPNTNTLQVGSNYGFLETDIL